MNVATAPALPAGARRRRRRLVVALAVMVIIIAVVGTVAVVIFRPGLYMSTPNLEIITEDGTGGEVGSTFPAVSGTDYGGNPVSIGPEDSPAAIALVAHWCDFCQDETRELAAAMAAGDISNPDAVYLIATQHIRFTHWPPEEALGLADYPGTVLVDTNSALANHLQMRGTPTWYFTDSDGVIRDVFQGFLTPAEIEEHLGRAS